MKKLDYPYSVTDWETYDFTDCYSSLYMYLERMSAEKVDYHCTKQDGGDCSWCGVCYSTGTNPPAKMKEDLNYTFQTLAGLTAAAVPWEGTNAALKKVGADTPEFLFGYTGYGYELTGADFAGKLKKSADAGTPAIAQLKSGGYRIVAGYDGDGFIALEKNTQRLLAEAEIENVYIITEKTAPSYTLSDGLKRIKYVMESDVSVGVWDAYINSFNSECGLDELKEKARKVDNAMIWNVHAFGRAFYLRRLPELQDGRISQCIEDIGWACDDSHTARWQGKSMYWCRDWTRMDNWSVENGYRTLMQDVLRRIKKDDAINLDAVCRIINILQ